MTAVGALPAAAGPSAADTAERARTLVAPALRRALDGLVRDLDGMAAYGLGWVDGSAAPDPVHGGKALRPALALLAAEAAGAPAGAAVAGAAAVELVHAFSLVHDDIMDGDEERRHRPSLWRRYGNGPAVLAGDALLALAVRTVTETGHPAAPGLLSATLVELVNGQALDIGFERRPWTGPGAVTTGEYTSMAALKTGSLFGCALALGTLLGGAPPERVTAAARIGRDLGVAFQAVDDLLGLWGEPATTGKPVFGDLGLGKKTLPLVAALAARTRASRRLARVLGAAPDPRGAGHRMRQVAGLVGEAGGRAYTVRLAEDILQRTLHRIDAISVDGVATSGLAALAVAGVRRAC